MRHVFMNWGYNNDSYGDGVVKDIKKQKYWNQEKLTDLGLQDAEKLEKLK